MGRGRERAGWVVGMGRVGRGLACAVGRGLAG